MNSRSRSLYVIVRPLSVVCNVCAPYSDDWNFRQYAIWYFGHRLTSR